VEGERLTQRLRLHQPIRRHDDAGQCARAGEASFHDASSVTAPALNERFDLNGQIGFRFNSGLSKIGRWLAPASKM
jgi:hypothetical protein